MRALDRFVALPAAAAGTVLQTVRTITSTGEDAADVVAVSELPSAEVILRTVVKSKSCS